MIAFIITLIAAVVTAIIFTLSCHKEEVWKNIYKRK
jgi:hypothetical protein